MALSTRNQVPIVVDLTAGSDVESEDEAAVVPFASAVGSDISLTNRLATATTTGATVSARHIPTQTTTANAFGGSNDLERDAKRRKLSTSRASAIAHDGTRHGKTATAPTPFTPATANHDSLRVKLNGANGIPSVSFMNAALKPSASSIPSLNDMPAQAARPLFIGRMPLESVATGLPSPGLTTPESMSGGTNDSDPLAGAILDEVELADGPNAIAPTTAAQSRSPPHPSSPRKPGRVFETSKHNDRHGATADLPTRQSMPHTLQQSPTPAVSATNNSTKNKHRENASEEEDHLLIFLKEVKRLKWADITQEFSKDIQGRSYSQLQTRYSSILNKRDRSKDPPALNLPSRFAAEATIDWATVHANTASSRASADVSHARATKSLRRTPADKPRGAVYQTKYDGDSSGTESMPTRQRARRAPPVDYTWPQLRTVHGGLEETCTDTNEPVVDTFANSLGFGRSESPNGESLVTTSRTTSSRTNLLGMDFQSHDAELGLALQKDLRKTPRYHIPYLSSLQRHVMRERPGQWTWDQSSMRDWQGVILHVDFSPAELQTIEKLVTRIIPLGGDTRHSTYKRHLRTILRNVSEPKLKMLTHEVSCHLPSRDVRSIASFLEDAAAGKISDVPQIQRLAPAKAISTQQGNQLLSIPSCVRQRELGLLMRRGRRTASRPLTYQLQNQISDTLGPESTWTGASSDIHTVAWSPDGRCFAAGAVAVTDVDSMQYNRPNVLMYGDTATGDIHELGKHYIHRAKTDAGANSTHAMFESQDPRLYTTVTSVGFSSSGRLMYSAGYDHSVCVWDVAAGSQQPQLVRELGHQSPVDCLAVNQIYDGIIATATKRTTDKSIKLVEFHEDNINDEPWQHSKTNFASAKAVSRPDLNMSATALKFDPTGRLLLAGFGANMREDSGLDTSGDICLWDVETQAALPVYGSSRNVFDVAFNSLPRQRGDFAVGCVANGNVNRGTRSVVRFYSPKQSKYTCPLELECKAFDMNDVVWCPYDENLFAAGCTDGRSYTWDLRMPSKVLYTLTHGQSLMPLQDGVSHERTDTGVRFLSWGQNARRLYSGSSDGVVKVWDIAQSQDDVFIKDLVTTNSGIMSGAFTVDFSKLVLGEVNGTANVLEVGRDDVAVKDADGFTYRPYEDDYDDDEDSADAMVVDTSRPQTIDIAATEARRWLATGELRLAPMGGLPKQQVIQGPNYAGPFDRGEDVDTLFLRETASEFQRNMALITTPQCHLPGCAENINTTTYEEVGDSGRSADRIPDEMRRQWLDETLRVVPGKSKCTICSRPAIPALDQDVALCEHCSFACFRCGTAGSIMRTTSTLECDRCGGAWESGVLGYECIRQPANLEKVNAPPLKRFGKESYLERLDDADAAFGDEMNALTEYYFGLAIDRPESPPL